MTLAYKLSTRIVDFTSDAPAVYRYHDPVRVICDDYPEPRLRRRVVEAESVPLLYALNADGSELSFTDSRGVGHTMRVSYATRYLDLSASDVVRATTAGKRRILVRTVCRKCGRRNSITSREWGDGRACRVCTRASIKDACRPARAADKTVPMYVRFGRG